MKYCLLFIIIISIVTISVLLCYKDKFSQPALTHSPTHTWKGLCLFDIDGTLTTGIDNFTSVNICLQAGYAVGISTAGAMYTPNNLLSFSWMPKNLYIFMQNHGFDTFNNVASGIIAGRHDPSAYQDIRDQFWGQHVMWGVMKGLSAIVTASKYGINPNNIILFDNDPGFLEGLAMYNPEITAVCAGSPCGRVMTPQTIITSLK